MIYNTVSPNYLDITTTQNTSVVDIPFAFYGEHDIDVYVGDNLTPKVLGVDYTVIGAPTETVQARGSIRFTVEVPAHTRIFIIRNTDEVRLTDFEKAAYFEEKLLDSEFNNILRMVQDSKMYLTTAAHIHPMDIGKIDTQLPTAFANGIISVDPENSKLIFVDLKDHPDFVEMFATLRKEIADAEYRLDATITQVDGKQTSWNEEQDNRLTALETSITSDSRYIHWNYTAKGGEDKIVLPYKFTMISEVFINGVRQTYLKAFEYSTVDYSVSFAEALDADDDVVVSLGIEPLDSASDEFNGSVPMPEPRQYGDGVTTRFKAPHTAPADANAFFVYIDGVKQSHEAGDFTVPAVLSLEFSEAPPKGAAIDITYFRPFSSINDLEVTATGSTTPRKISDRFGDVVNVKDFGAVGDGVTDDTNAVQLAVKYCVTNKKPMELTGIHRITNTIDVDGTIYITGNGYYSGFFVDGTISGDAAFRIKGDDSHLKDFRLYGKSPSGFKLQGINNRKVSRTLFENLDFEGLTTTDYIDQCIWLWTSSHTTIQNCSFNTTGYGIISQYGYYANDVLINGCSFDNMLTDAVEANSGGSVTSERWVISNCTYDGGAGYPNRGAEHRFVGTAAVNDVIIIGNNILRAGGDSAIHIESNGGRTIVSSNTLRDCYGSDGNLGWVYLLNSTKDCSVVDNTFIYQVDNGTQVGISVSSGSYRHRCSWSNNTFIDESGTSQFVAISAKSIVADGGIVISNNVCTNLHTFLDCNNSDSMTITGNICRFCTYGIWNNAGSTGGGIANMVISNNMFDGGEYALLIKPNSNGTGRCRRLIISNNMLYGQKAHIRSCDDIQITNNIVGENTEFLTDGNRRSLVQYNTRINHGLIM